VTALTWETAGRLVEQAMERAQQAFARPVCVAVCDAQGFLLAFARMPGAPVRSIAISQGKAYSAARMSVNTDAFLARIRREQIDVSYFCDPHLTALPGGSVLKDKAGVALGAIGVSGLTSAEDQQVTDQVAAWLLANPAG
jgi:glc operon protein GlcG